MRPYQIISDSSCDIAPELIKENGLGIVPYFVSFDGETYYKEIYELIPNAFYEKINESALFPKTSQPTIQDYIDVFEPYLKEGKDILCLCLTSNFSGSYQSAVNAKNILEEAFPEARIEVLDSRNVTGVQGLLVWETIRMRNKGFTLDQQLEKIDVIKGTTKINFTVDSLEHLQKGGRIGKAAALAGTILNIKPIIVAQHGELLPESKVRGHKKALRTIMDMTRQEIGDKKEQYRLLMLYAEKERKEATEELANELIAEGFELISPPLAQVGITIGTHAGPTAIGICYIKKHECF
ncbi:DegV domain-containing protein [Anaerotignum neopropionicum]|uniref:DegV domain-containing protein n=1 Tax=Anaerotignum neopropionicum TaxID=36847 RepID=A0A136WF96_9FIRM|nr:DegV family protein [Anaerotignum neopropionicum]KXL53181.1 DegV domain-containing protein [Anaerotignum neopropionicum]